jgi:Nif-specific regulatory protein
VQRAVLMARNKIITVQDIVFDDVQVRSNETDYFSTIINKLSESSLKELISHFEADVILHTLKETNGNVMQTAGMLALGKTALYDKMKRHNINVKSWK